jgi:polysaccharide biosynthesis protein PslH
MPRLVKVLLVAPRTPWPPYTGDRLRANMWIEALRSVATLVVVTPVGTAKPHDVAVIGARRSATALIASTIRTVAQRTPLHALLGASRNWRAALAEAERKHGSFDLAIVLLSRTDPAVFPFLSARHRILDAIDSAARGMDARAAAAGSVLRSFWRREARRAAALEQSATNRYDAIVTVGPEESAMFGSRAVTIPMGVDVAPIDATPRRYDFGFWGRFPYFANEEAVRLLLEVIWPDIRRRRPSATLFLGGADAPRWLRRHDGREGISVISPVIDRRMALRQVQVGLLPILSGTGQSLKTLEMAEAGCAIIGTAMAFRGVESLAAEAVVEDDVKQFAGRAIALLDSAAVAGARIRSEVVAHHDRADSLTRMRALAIEVGS